MPSSASTEETETLLPPPPVLLPPWHTPEREELQLQARRFAMDEVLPVANELDERVTTALETYPAGPTADARRIDAVVIGNQNTHAQPLDKWRRGRAPTRADRPIDAEARSLADSPGPLSRALVSARAAAGIA